MNSNKLDNIFVSLCIGSAALLLPGLIGGATFMGIENHVDHSLTVDVNTIAENTERILLSEGKEAAEKDISGLRVPAKISSDETTIQMSGTFKDGYCIVGRNPRGQAAEKGIFYSVSKNGIIDKEETDCTRNISNESIVYGPSINRDYTKEIELSDVFYTMFFGSIPVFIGAISVGAAGTRQRKREDEGENSNEAALAVVPLKPEEDADSEFPVKRIKPKEIVMDKVRSISQRLEFVKNEWASYELDLVKILDYPAVTNMGVPATAEFHKALRTAQSHTPVGGELDTAEIMEFNRAVTDLEYRYDVMISEAKRMKWNDYSSKERISLSMAQNLLAIASNSASSANERQIAYKRLIKEVEGIIVLPEKTLLELEARMPPEIEEGIQKRESLSI